MTSSESSPNVFNNPELILRCIVVCESLWGWILCNQRNEAGHERLCIFHTGKIISWSFRFAYVFVKRIELLAEVLHRHVFKHIIGSTKAFPVFALPCSYDVITREICKLYRCHLGRPHHPQLYILLAFNHTASAGRRCNLRFDWPERRGLWELNGKCFRNFHQNGTSKFE